MESLGAIKKPFPEELLSFILLGRLLQPRLPFTELKRDSQAHSATRASQLK